MIRIGISGWSYDHWEGRFFPEDLPKKGKLDYASRQFDSLEINGSFYSLLSPKTYEKYRETAPEGFVFAVKGSRFITHSKKLKDVKIPVANFFASGVVHESLLTDDGARMARDHGVRRRDRRRGGDRGDPAGGDAVCPRSGSAPCRQRRMFLGSQAPTTQFG